MSAVDLVTNDRSRRVLIGDDPTQDTRPRTQYVLEPPIVDTPKSGQPPYNGQTVCPLPTTVCMLEPPKKGQPPNNGQNTSPQVSIVWRFHCNSVDMQSFDLIQEGLFC